MLIVPFGLNNIFLINKKYAMTLIPKLALKSLHIILDITLRLARPSYYKHSEHHLHHQVNQEFGSFS